MSIPKIDSKVIGWVNVINSYPDLETVGSCGGHNHPKNCTQTPKNEFYVQFRFKTPTSSPNEKGWQSLFTLMQYITVYGLLANPDQWIKIDVCMISLFDIYFTLRGHEVDRDEFQGWFFKIFNPYEGEYKVCVHNTSLNLCEFRDFIETQIDEIENGIGVSS